ncbi:DUF4176 domain-containing protein [Paenibacillus melissococcoides]|uniref:DUF4176 domain-containing protein n=1 Tax=Paenibacillus melissococcoides TaxID=2912268 RepID=A0ABM9FZ91_9BACL|nr:DUF4176 domain-containing protein [Paenibacillus melissococcoides]CAH8244589.1 DUF4176 domain-containing protein [Paenibacillus melissococcoides]CAH8708428.1 DUF4176 domain-containing protein [Paenibacillus melissococcoides]CAH8709140.1 DUF4176 domain-containing protein [Paenibacillus melissococcoides]
MLLPIGSVVLLKDAKKRVMIFGRLQKQGDKIWDYIALPYPEGNIDPNLACVFNHEYIDTVCFKGFQDMEEVAFNQILEDYRERMDASN